MIEIRSLTKRHRARAAVDDLSFTVQPGTVTGFLGPNGAGKSTTLRILVGLERPSSGEALVAGRSYRDLTNPLRTVGALLDAGWVHPKRTARHHLRWLARSNGLAATRVDEVLQLVGLADVASRKAGTFSLGMSQRLGIAAALLGDPSVLVFDEPANGLDAEGIGWFRGLAHQLAADGRTVLVTSHQLAETAQLASELVIIGRGRLLAHCPTSDLVGSGSTLEERYLELTAADVEFTGGRGTEAAA